MTSRCIPAARLVLLFAILGVAAPLAAQPPRSAYDACADAARTLVRQETRWDESRYRGDDADILRWRAQDGTRGICRVDASGRVFEVRVEHWGSDDVDVVWPPRGGTRGLSEERGYDRRGADYTSFQTRSLDECQSACRRDERCRAYTWDQGSDRCYLKSEVRPQRPARDRVSGVKGEGFDRGGELTEERGFDRRGGDYTSFDTGRLETCQDACARDERCRAYAYDAGRGVCYLKDRVPSSTRDSGVISGYKREPGS